LDVVTYIRDWDRGVKYLADAGMLENSVLFLTGSDLVIIQEARMRFPERRGMVGVVDFHLYPLNFLETVKLKKRFDSDEVERLMNPEIEPTASALDILYKEFELYLIHGGFLTAINDIARHNRIIPSTFATYSDWIRGDVLKRGRQEHYLREILGAIIKRYGTRCMANRKR
jgi:predicted AAA+ superfamily ATPase